MSVTQSNPEELRNVYAALKAVTGPVIGGAIEEIAAAADFELSNEGGHPFVEFVHWINTRPAFINRWRNDPAAEKRDYIRFMTVTDSTRSAYAAVCYHLGRLKEIEGTVNNVLSRYDFTNQLPPNSVAAIGRMRQLDFEYHAFVLAYRRSLDYLVVGLSTYFKQRQSSYNGFAKLLASASPQTVGLALKTVYDRHSEKFKFVMDAERGRSTRDRISHWEFVQAAQINVGKHGHSFVGGGERLRLADPNDQRSLSDILEQRTKDLHACISDFLTTFRIVVTEFETNNP